MNQRGKAILIFTIIYFLLTIIALVLFGLAFDAVPINWYGLRRNYFSSFIEEDYYCSGLYHKDVSYYFIPFPSSNQYLTDLRVNVTNQKMQVIGVEFTLVYQLMPDQIYNLYERLSTNYQQYIISEIKGILSNYFMTMNNKAEFQIQQQLVNDISSNFGSKISILQSAVAIKAFWINQYTYYGLEDQYEQAYKHTNTHSQAYQELQIELERGKMQVDILKNSLHYVEEELNLELENMQEETMLNETRESSLKLSEQEAKLAQMSKVSQIFQYYHPTQLIFI